MSKSRTHAKLTGNEALPRKKSAASSTDPLARLIGVARDRELVIVIGTGVSMGLTKNNIRALSWKGLVEHGFAHGIRIGKITAAQAASWKAQIDSVDPDDLLSAAEFMSHKLGAPRGDLYARWLDEVFRSVRPVDRMLMKALRSIRDADIPICTLNYDRLLEQVLGLPSINLSETAQVLEWMRRERPGILHLHGSFDAPQTCILGIRDYETTIGDDVRALIQRSLSAFSRLLFIGCGGTFADPNFVALIKWLREKLHAATPMHYALVSDGEVAARHSDPAWLGFVEPLSYGEGHDVLASFLLKHFSSTTASAPKKKSLSTKTNSSTAHLKLIQNYCAFLVRDCGQMTIEGLRADMDTAQRRFDIERLFVPLKLLPCPPEIRNDDSESEEKFLAWKKQVDEPVAFGKVFERHQRLALLALPGGGKTLLLKRLAVAYADPSRRSASDDELPERELIPVLIRCREWREYISLPIATLLRSIPDITGQTALVGLSDALLPMFKAGRILLLVDGLDEIHEDGNRSTFVKHLEAFLDEYHLTTLVVTSREAGFSLVAPCIARFCDRWRVAPLFEHAITELCKHWHRLMKGDSPATLLESTEVSQYLLRNDSLRRLAENPLLLTMLLVVKHGAGGRLPPDRVTLYERAVEVLLDTWNIEGHAPLSLKEAVPQLACVAFQLMRLGKQTATERELLLLLEEAREEVPQIRRYAKDTPYAFLKRVELRSSLLIEAGHQVENGRPVPFYQFRHLTFQEYLAAVSASDGHYLEYKKGDTVLTPLEPFLTAEEWKQVVPMAAVLAGKQAEPLMAALVSAGNELRDKVETGDVAPTSRQQPYRLPAPVARLVQCLAEEAEAAPETLTAALQVVSMFARGVNSDDDWTALCRGPYCEELLHQTWIAYESMRWPSLARLDFTYVNFMRLRHPESYWKTKEAQMESAKLLCSQKPEEISRGLATCVCLLWAAQDKENPTENHVAQLLPLVEKHLFDDPGLHLFAVWAWGLIHSAPLGSRLQPPLIVLDGLLRLVLSTIHQSVNWFASWALSTMLGLQREYWCPKLTSAEIQQMRQLAETYKAELELGFTSVSATLGIYMVAFHSKQGYSDAELATLFAQDRDQLRYDSKEIYANKIRSVLRQLGQFGQKYIDTEKPSRMPKAIKQ